jgi:hypothetical protein
MFNMFDSFFKGVFGGVSDTSNLTMCPHCLCDEDGPVLAEVAYAFSIKEPKLEEKHGKFACVRCHKQFKKREELLGNLDLAYIVLMSIPTELLIKATKRYLEFRASVRKQMDE